MKTTYNIGYKSTALARTDEKIYTQIKKSCQNIQGTAVQKYLETMFPKTLTVPEDGKLVLPRVSKLGR